MIESPPVEPASPPSLRVALAQVCVVDGIWQDAPDHIASFDEERLTEGGAEEAAALRGRGSLYVLLDVSGDIEGRGDIERELIETIRREYSRHRGSVTFGLSEALRAANGALFDLNLQAPRESRRMAGISAVVLRGGDLYIAQAGPTVAYVEVSGTLHRYPADSDWFQEDSPVIAPVGNASPPLGVRREFACDLFHAAVSAADVFVIAHRALTQLAATEELAAAFEKRAVEDIANYLEEVADGSDLSALIGELLDPRDLESEGTEPPVEIEVEPEPPAPAPVVEKRAEVKALPAPEPVAEDEKPEPEAAAEPPPEAAVQPPPVAAVVEKPIEEHLEAPPEDKPQPPAQPEYEIDWGVEPKAEEAEAELEEEEEEGWSEEEQAEPGPEEQEEEPGPGEEPEPLMAARAARPARSAPQTAAERQAADEQLARLREERRKRRAAQLGAIGQVFKIAGRGLTSAGRGFALAGAALLALVVMLGRSLAGLAGIVDWKRVRARLNRWLNSAAYLLWNGAFLLVRLMLPGQVGKQTLIPRRQSKEPIWLRGIAVILPVLFLGMALASYYQQGSYRADQATRLVQQAQTLLASAQTKLVTDRTGAKADLTQALAAVNEARSIQDSDQARKVTADIQDQMNAADGVTILKDFTLIARLTTAGADISQVVVDDNDIYFFDRGNQRVYHYRAVSGGATPDSGDGNILQLGARIGNVTVDRIKDIAGSQGTGGAASGGVLALTGNAILQYDGNAGVWHSYPVTDAAQWGNIRAIGSFSGNLYLLDAAKGQIWKYLSGTNGYSGTATPYFPANAAVNLSRAVDMSIDGRIWVLNSDGSVMRFESGQPRPFEITGLKTPIKTGTAIYTRADNEMASIYVLDGGNARIVELDKSGRFAREFKPSVTNAGIFANLKTLFANPANRKFYLVSGNTIYMTDIK